MSFDELVADMDAAALELLGGELVTYTPAVGEAVQVTGIFDANYEIVKGSPEFGVEAVGPSIFFRLSDLPVDPDDDDPTITIGPALNRPAALVGDYRVVGRPRDDQGGVVLQLRKA